MLGVPVPGDGGVLAGSSRVLDGGATDAGALDGGTQVLAPNALRPSAAVLDGGAVPGTGPGTAALAEPLSPDEVRYVQDELSHSAEVTDLVMPVLVAVAGRRGVTINPQSLDLDLLTEPEPEATLSQFGGSPDDWRALLLGTEVAQIARELLRTIEQEYAGLPMPAGFVTIAQAQKTDPLVYYRQVRSRMYREGWRDPARFWREIVPVKLDGKNVENGVHRLIRDRLEAGAQDLTEPFAEGVKVVTTAIGFQPRVIKGQDVLSNHAWGLAVDVNANLNPYITDKEVMRVVRDHTSGHVNLREQTVDPAHPDDSTLETRYAVLAKASEEVSAWLVAAVPREAELRSQLDDAEERLRLAGRSGDRAALAAAEQRLKQAQQAYDSDPLVPADVAVLRSRLGDKVIATWQQSGFLTLPLDFVKAVKEHGLAWGGEFERVKDFMHFDLPAGDVLDRGWLDPPAG